MTPMQELVLSFLCILAISGWLVYRSEKKKPRGYRG